jgi:aldose 1-epimerase
MTNDNMITLSAGNVEVVIDAEHGSRLSSVRFGETELLVQRNSDDSFSWGCYPMAPWAGRTRNGVFEHQGSSVQLPINSAPHAIHGLVHDAVWQVVNTSPSSATLRVEFDQRWPFAGWVEHHISVDSASVNLQLTVHAYDHDHNDNHNDKKLSMPAQVGWHPWFVRPVQLEAEFKTMYVRDSDGIAVTKCVHQQHDLMHGQLDDCFTDTVTAPVLKFENGPTVRLESDCSHWVVYNEPSHAICVEPQSGPPNGLNSEPLVVSPSQPLTRFFRLTALGYR